MHSIPAPLEAGFLSGHRLTTNRPPTDRQPPIPGPQVSEWFASRCDLIFLLFDPYKLDISDEFKQARSLGV
jgi:hypothetical protein